LDYSEPVLVRAGALVTALEMNATETKDLVCRLRECRSEEKMLSLIGQEETFRQKDQKRVVLAPNSKRLKNRDRIIRELRNLNTLLTHNASKEALELTSLTDFSEAKGLAGDVVEKLQKVFKV
jgi:hypothetical protein